MQTISRSSSSAVTFIFLPVTEFFLFMKHLYLDVLPLPKSKHGKKKGIHGVPLAYLFCFSCIFIFKQELWVFPAQSQSFTSVGWSQVLLIPTQCCFIPVLLHFHSLILVHALYFQTILGFPSKTACLYSFLIFMDAIKSYRILLFKCLLSSKTVISWL